MLCQFQSPGFKKPAASTFDLLEDSFWSPEQPHIGSIYLETILLESQKSLRALWATVPAEFSYPALPGRVHQWPSRPACPPATNQQWPQSCHKQQKNHSQAQPKFLTEKTYELLYNSGVAILSNCMVGRIMPPPKKKKNCPHSNITNLWICMLLYVVKELADVIQDHEVVRLSQVIWEGSK